MIVFIFICIIFYNTHNYDFFCYGNYFMKLFFVTNCKSFYSFTKNYYSHTFYESSVCIYNVFTLTVDTIEFVFEQYAYKITWNNIIIPILYKNLHELKI